MHRFKRSAIVVSTTMTLAAAASGDISWSYLPGGDAAFLALTNNGTLERAVTEGRIGNNGTSGTWELGIWQFGGVGAPQSQAQYSWSDGQPTAFSILYDGASTITYTVGSTSIAWNGMQGPFTDIFIRTRSATDSSLLLSSMDISGTAIGDLSSIGNGDVNYIRIQNGGANFGAFTITGFSTFDWGVQPTNSALAYQFKFSNVVPAPGAALLLGLAGIAGRRRRA